MRFSLSIIVICIAVLLGGCATKSVLVIDVMKSPIRDAKVEPITLSMNLAVKMTDKSGVVTLPHSPQKIEWVSVNKDGFEPSGQIPISTSDQTVVVLQRTK